MRKLSFKVESQEKRVLLKGYTIGEEKIRVKSKELTLNAAALNCGTELNVHSPGSLVLFQYSIAEKTAM